MIPLTDSHPDIAALWHPMLNGSLTPDQISAGSGKKTWWICPRNHAYDMVVGNRLKGRIDSCPVCSGKRVLEGFNDLTSTSPHVATQWHPTKNQGSQPQDFTRGSSHRAWWLCDEGHEWDAVINLRTKGVGCPYCAGRYVTKGINDLASQRPDIAAQWHPVKNGSLTPETITVRNDKRVWWQCAEEHEWEAAIGNRTAPKGGTGCPVCSNSVVVAGVNDLRLTHPEIAALWHPIKNDPLTPEQVSAGSGKEAWWTCALGHDWKSSVKNLTGAGSQCPYCSNKAVLPGYNDLATINPAVASMWHPTRNAEVTAQDVTRASNYYAWWKCASGHEWQTWVYARAAGNGCPMCRTQSSQGERVLGEWLRSLGINVQERVVGLLTGRFEVDLYLPDHQFAIEFNGLYWHSEAVGKGREYHRAKVDAAQASGIYLFQVWEDDWNDRQEIVKRMILHRLGLSQEPVIYARQTQIINLSAAQARDFLDAHHIQGFASGSLYYGLVETANSQLIAVMVLKQMSNGSAYLERYATSCRVPGGFTRLLKHVERTVQPTKIITFADYSLSQGDLYEQSGFVADRILDPDYSYLTRRQRVHKFNYRLKRFRDDPNLLWQDGLTEKELANLNGLIRIWDSGKIRYMKQV